MTQRTAPTRKEVRWTLLFVSVGVVLVALTLRPRPTPVVVPPPLPHLDRILERGTLRIATVNSPVTYFNVQDREIGFEYDLARRFAADLGVELEVRTAPFHRLLDLVTSGEVDLAAASITVTPERRQRVRFGPAYQEVTQEVVYRAGSNRPTSPEDLVGRNLWVVAGSSYAETLRRLKAILPDLSWREIATGDIEMIFAAITSGDADVTIADSNIFAMHRRFFPRLAEGFALTEPQPIAWAFPQGEDRSLIERAEQFFARIKANGRLARIIDRYTAHIPDYDRLNTRYLLRHIRTRLPGLRPYFRQAAEATGFDWRLLAAVAYQESHWDPQAVSPTGVRGIMMLTRATAEEMGVSDRRDPKESILAGAEYLKRMHDKIPARIEEPDRTWMALAAYNVGWGHLEDARILTQRMGGNPDRWADVAKHLPLLSDRRYYRDLRFGYARGREPVRYVGNIRSYYDILTWKTGRDQSAVAAP
ncbi:MAG: membrane-bound lytic murein transglycosylase MltF [Xanthomonadales bacterium]|nr:membrane-bound lytic murein transglycosylase MltF [Xanthomonadales bacterium]